MANSFNSNNFYFDKSMYLKDKNLKKRYSIFPIINDDLWQMYKKAESQTWVAEEIDLSKDKFDELKDKARELFSQADNDTSAWHRADAIMECVKFLKERNIYNRELKING